MAPELVDSLVRGLIAAFIAGATAALTTASQTDDVKKIVLAGLGSFVGVLALRLGEGAVDVQKAKDPSSSQHAARVLRLAKAQRTEQQHGRLS